MRKRTEGIDYSSQHGASRRQMLAAVTIYHQDGGCRYIYGLCLLSAKHLGSQMEGSGDTSGSGLPRAGP